MKDTEVCVPPCLFKKEIVEWLCLSFHDRAALKFMYSLKVRKTCLKLECSGSSVVCTWHVIRLNTTQRAKDWAKTASLLVCQSLVMATCETDLPKTHSSLCSQTAYTAFITPHYLKILQHANGGLGCRASPKQFSSLETPHLHSVVGVGLLAAWEMLEGDWCVFALHLSLFSPQLGRQVYRYWFRVILV